jgi:hypothetical protein
MTSSQEWADRASKLALKNHDFPNEDNLVTYIILTHYWSSQGRWQRGLVYEGNASCTARLLGLTGRVALRGTSLADELSRRRFWATFVLNQFVVRAAYPTMDLDEYKHVPLPCREEDFELAIVPDQLLTLEDNVRTESFHAELVRIGSLW